MRKRGSRTVRLVVSLAVLALVAVGYFTAFGIGNVSAIGWDVFSLLCPVGYLESLLASKTFVPRALLSFVVVVALVLVVGRAFCAWVCPMPVLQRWFPGFSRKKGKRAADGAAAGDALAKPGEAALDGAGDLDAAVGDAGAAAQAADAPARKPPKAPLDSRLAVLVGALASAAVFGFPVFCLVCPVGLTFATVFLVMRLFAFGDLTWGVVVVPVVLLIEVLFLRKWCSKICPLGALLSLISTGNKTLRPTIDDAACLHTAKGVACFACSHACDEKIDIRRPELSEAALGNCTKCRACADVCPAQAITFPFLPKGKGGIDAGESR